MRRGCDAALARIVQPDIRISLRCVLTAAKSKYDTVGHQWGLGLIHIARHPCGRQPWFAVLVLDLIRHQSSMCDGAIRYRHFEFRMDRSPEGCNHPTGAVRILPACQD